VTATLGLLGFSWALVASADYRHEQRPAVYETVVREVATVSVREVATVSEWEAALEVPTPIADSLVDWVELERQTDCLWEYLEQSGVEITLEIVLAAGTWTDALGGACLVIGEDSE
jgi:hypothetical protein